MILALQDSVSTARPRDRVAGEGMDIPLVGSVGVGRVPGRARPHRRGRPERSAAPLPWRGRRRDERQPRGVVASGRAGPLKAVHAAVSAPFGGDNEFALPVPTPPRPLFRAVLGPGVDHGGSSCHRPMQEPTLSLVSALLTPSVTSMCDVPADPRHRPMPHRPHRDRRSPGAQTLPWVVLTRAERRGRARGAQPASAGQRSGLVVPAAA